MAEVSRINENELRKIFKQLDADASGSISESELLSKAMKSFGVTCSRNSAKKILAKVDKDGSGQIEWDEFVDFYALISDPQEIKALLSEANQCYFDYKCKVVDGNRRSFSKEFTIPPVAVEWRIYRGHDSLVGSVGWASPSQLVSSSIDGDILVWDTATAKKDALPQRKFVGDGTPLYCMAVSKDGNQAFCGMDANKDNVWLQCLRENRLTKYGGHQTTVYGCAVSDDGLLGISGDKGGVVCVHDLEGSETKPSETWQAHGGIVFSCAFSSMSVNRTFCSTSADGHVKIFDLRALQDGKPVWVIEDAATAGNVYQALWRNDYEIISCGDDMCAKRWDIRGTAPQAVSSYLGHTSPIRSMDVSPCGGILVTGTEDGSIRSWVVDEGSICNEKLDAVRVSITTLDTRRGVVQELVQSGAEVSAADFAEFRGADAQIEELSLEAERIESALQKYQASNHTQAVQALGTHASTVTSIAWVDLDDGTSLVASGSNDTSVRLYKADSHDLSRIH